MSGGRTSLLTLVLAGVARLRARYVGLALLVLVSTAASVFGTLVGSYASGRGGAVDEDTEELRVVSVYASQDVLTDGAVRALQGLPGVESAAPFIRVPAGMQSTGADLSLVGIDGAGQPPIIAGEMRTGVDERGVPGIVLPATIGTLDLRPLVGTAVEVTYTVAVDSEAGFTRTQGFVVTGVSDPSYQVDALNAAYIDQALAVELYMVRTGADAGTLAAHGGYERVRVVASEQGSVDEVTRAIQAQGYQAVSRVQELAAVPGVIALIRLASGVLSAVLLIISAIAALVLASSLARQRTRELGVLRAIGWAPRRVLVMWVGELGLVALASVAVGTVGGVVAAVTLGAGLRDGVADGQLGVIDVGPTAVVAVPVLFLLLTVVPALLVTVRHARADVVTLLRHL